MTSYRFQNVHIDSQSLLLPSQEVTSRELEDRIAPVYEKLRVPFGTLEKLSGIKSRYLWSADQGPSQFATEVCSMALEESSIPREKIGAIINGSVTRDYFEPSTSCLVHGNLEFSENVVAFDVTNACIGFSNSLLTAATMIESGVIEAALICSAENTAWAVESNIRHVLETEDLTREQLLKLIPTFTLGCGAVAMVLCHKRLAKTSHRVVGAVCRSATQWNRLCVGNGDFAILDRFAASPIMHTESGQLITEAAKLGGRLWRDYEEFVGWSPETVDRIFCHQVGKQVNEAFYAEEGLDMAKEFTVYQRYGNLVSAALPSCFITAAQEVGFQENEKLLWTAYGSGLNGAFVGIEW